MEELVSGSVTFNKFKVKYAYMNEYFLFNQNAQEKKTFYFFIDFDYVLRQYMHSLECFDFRYISSDAMFRYSDAMFRFKSSILFM